MKQNKNTWCAFCRLILNRSASQKWTEAGRKHASPTLAISWPIRTYFTRWLIHTNSYNLILTILYDLSKHEWRVLSLGYFFVIFLFCSCLSVPRLTQGRHSREIDAAVRGSLNSAVRGESQPAIRGSLKSVWFRLVYSLLPGVPVGLPCLVLTCLVWSH